ncbi:MAG: DUF2202 domain-containing protein [Phycisphaerae bacterium]|nr:DUF2202 domain-containing protein [Phycisphaerae bacterium]
MKTKLTLTLIAGLLLTFTNFSDARGPKGTQQGTCNGTCQVTETPILTELETEHILWMRQEEKLARDVYLTLYDMYQVPVFYNIASSEQNHMNALLNLVNMYELTDTVASDEVGVFQDETFTNLYNDLVQLGSQSLIEAIKVGALIEEMDIYDIKLAIEDTQAEPVILIYENLMRGSRNHLRAFAGLLDAFGEVYEPQYLTQEEFDQIAYSAKETGAQSKGANSNKSRARKGR